MNDNNPPGNWPDRAAALGAGLASAVLFAASTRGSGLSVALAYFCPLPLLIGALGFSPLAALAGACLGALGVAASASPASGLSFLLGFAAPALAVAVLARRALPAAADDAAPLPRYPAPGALLTFLFAFCVLTTWLGVAFVAHAHGGFDAALAALVQRYAEPLDDVVENLRKMPAEFDAATIKRMILLGAPAAIAASQTLLLAVNLWLAARVVEISGRLGRPWPALPEHLALPRLLAPAFLIACGLCFSGGLIGALAGAFAAAAGLCLAIQGLAVLHALSRDSKLRGALLSAVYAAALVLQPWSLVTLALLGVAESAFCLRARKARRLAAKT
jgi:uncharacterized protein YybS (DUF2232 family)